MRPLYFRDNENVKLIASEDDSETSNDAATLQNNDVELALRTLTMSSAVPAGFSAPLNECSLGLVYGNTAKLLDKTKQVVRDRARATHEWTLYVRPYNDSWDMSTLLREVVFITEPFYPRSRILEPPFEVTHIGWGEFAVSIELLFKKPFTTKKPLVLDHTITLVKITESKNDAGPSSSKDAEENYIVVPFMKTESYDEIIFPSSTQEQKTMFECATRGKEELPIDPECQHQRARREAIAAMQSAKKSINEDLAKTKEKLSKNIEEVKKLKLKTSGRKEVTESIESDDSDIIVLEAN